MTALCKDCADTGMRLDSDSEQYDCTSCGSAQARAKLDNWCARLFPADRPDPDVAWMIYQKGRLSA